MLRGSAKYVKQNLGNNLTVAEVGTRSGEYALVLLDRLPIKQLYMVDFFHPYQDGEFYQTADIQNFYCRELYRKVIFNNFCTTTLVQQPSALASSIFPDGFFDYVYIDACHDYDMVKLDLKNWFPKVKKNGILGGHDFKAFPGVEKAVREFSSNVEVFNDDGDWMIGGTQ